LPGTAIAACRFIKAISRSAGLVTETAERRDLPLRLLEKAG